MEIVVRSDAEAAADLAARIVGARVSDDPAITLGLATGRTMERVYDRLAAMHRDGLSFAGCTTFNLDEYVGLAPNDPNSYRAAMDRLLFGRIDINRAKTHVPDGCAADLVVEARRYEAAIAGAGGIGLQLLGIGETGHIGFNEPMSALLSRTRDKTLTPRTRAQNAAMFGGDPQAVPARAITMGVGTILDAREILLVAAGASKAEILARALEGPLTSMVTASALQLHPRCLVVADEAAGARLAGRAYYDFVFASEPHWAAFRDQE